MMRTPILVLCLGLVLGGCSILRKDDLAVCDGKHRRPANPNGSILDGGAANPSTDKLSALPPFFASCA
jgi:hypothetical protein